MATDFDQEYEETWGAGDDLHIEGLDFKLTCGACPEQYDVFYNGQEVGYVRLRWGRLRVNYPNFMSDEVVYERNFLNGVKGCFDGHAERVHYLNKIATAIHARILREELEDDE